MIRKALFALAFSAGMLNAQTKIPQPKPEVLSPPFTQPGIIANRSGQWVGSDHLFNLSHQIGIEVEILAPMNVDLPFTKEEVKKRVSELFRQGGLNPIPRGDTDISLAAVADSGEIAAATGTSGGGSTGGAGNVGPTTITRPPLKPEEKKIDKQKMIEIPKIYTPLPFFHVLIMVNPIEKGYVAYVGTRLFESVDIKREGARLEEQTAFQAITWERQLLIISSKEDLQKQIFSTVDELTDEFISRYDYFQSLRSRSN